jgi:hypothetical protein
MRFSPESLHGANAGLQLARELMEKIKKEYPWISYGDLWTLGGVAAVQVLFKSSNYLLELVIEALCALLGNGWPQDSLETWQGRWF